MSKKDLGWLDPSKEANEELSAELNNGEVDTSVPTHDSEESEEIPNVEDLINEEEINETKKNKRPEKLKILIFTKDPSILQDKSPAFQRISGLSDVFEEVHVVVLDEIDDGGDEVVRIGNNIWIYRTRSASWWKLGYDAYRLAEEQMVFGGGFRADVVIAEDPFESGLAGWFISKKYSCPLQLHIYEDFYDEAYLESTGHSSLYEWSSKYLLKRVQTVRTKTEFQKQAVIEENKKLEEFTEVLPSYYDLEAWRDAEPTFDLKEKYSKFNFIILHISSMQKKSHSEEVLAGSANILRRYPTIGLIVVGNGPLQSHLEKQAIELGIVNQVEFEPMPTETVSHLKSASLLMHLSENSEEDEIILASACVKLPMIANAKGLAGKLFTDNESAQLCNPSDTRDISNSINQYLNKNRDRSEFAMRAYEAVFEKIVQDYGTYLSTYKDSIEGCLFPEKEPNTEN